MNKSMYVVFVVCCLIGGACQREILNGRGNGTGLLVKMVNIYIPDNLDSYTQEFSYDTADKLWTIRATVRYKQANGSIIQNISTTQFFRDSNGKIVRTGSNPDTSAFNIIIVYENNSDRILYTKLMHRIGTVNTASDSIVFTYDNNNRVSRRDYYSLPQVQLNLL